MLTSWEWQLRQYHGLNPEPVEYVVSESKDEAGFTELDYLRLVLTGSMEEPDYTQLDEDSVDEKKTKKKDKRKNLGTFRSSGTAEKGPTVESEE